MCVLSGCVCGGETKGRGPHSAIRSKCGPLMDNLSWVLPSEGVACIQNGCHGFLALDSEGLEGRS